MNITDRQIGRSRWKNGVIYLVSKFNFWIIVLKLSKRVHFFQICTNLSKKFKPIKAIYIWKLHLELHLEIASANFKYIFPKMVLFIVLFTILRDNTVYHFGDNSVWSRRILLNFCWVSIFFDILIVNISWTVAQTPI